MMYGQRLHENGALVGQSSWRKPWKCNVHKLYTEEPLMYYWVEHEVIYEPELKAFVALLSAYTPLWEILPQDLSWWLGDGGRP